MRSLLVVLIVLLAQPRWAACQDTAPGELYLDLSQRGRITIALPGFVPMHPEAGVAAVEISKIVFDDISYSSMARVIDPKRYPESVPTPEIYESYYGWEAAKADVLVDGTVALGNGEIVSEIRLHAVKSKEVIFHTEYRTTSRSLRRLAHHIADDVATKVGYEGVARTDIAFASTRASDVGEKTIHVMNYDGHGQTRLSGTTYLDFQPKWLPGTQVVSFLSYPKKNELPILRKLGGGVLLEAQRMVFSSSWSPDGSLLAFSSTRDEAGNAEIYVMDRRGDIRRLTHHPDIDVSPTWSPDGSRIAFTSRRLGSPQIFVMDADGGNVRRISLKGSYNAEPAWSPLKWANEIAFASRVESGNFDIVVYDLDKEQLRQLTTGNGVNESPSWAPNGLHLAFTSDRTGTPHIFTMNRDGSNQRQLTHEGENTTPSWGPVPKRTRDERDRWIIPNP